MADILRRLGAFLASELGDEQRRQELRAASWTGYHILLILTLLSCWGPSGLFWAWAGSYALGYAIALPSKEWPAISTWIIVAGNAPIVLAMLLVFTSPIWGRNLPPAEEEAAEGAPEDSQPAAAYSNMAEQDADEAGEARGAADLHAAPRIVSWALRRNRDTETRDE